jgi:ATP-binding cassette subfamily A (ABC1) protein 3
MLIALYFERVMPNEWGTNLPYTFPFRASFWCPSKQPNAGAGTAASSEEERLKEDYDREHNVEKVDADTKRGLSLRISGLSKEYEAADGTTTKRRAVNNLSLEMYDGQIFSLLGHNGAGKTTLMSILTGMAPATSGQAVINGFNMSDSADVERVRQRFGFCPQHGAAHILFTSSLRLDLAPPSPCRAQLLLMPLM